MADVKTYLIAATVVPTLDVGVYNNVQRRAIANAAALNGDSIQLFPITRNARMISAHLRALATLGAACTLKLQRNRGGVRVDLTVATTAAQASLVNSSTIGPVDLLEGDIIECLVGGGNVGAAAGIEVDLLLQHA